MAGTIKQAHTGISGSNKAQRICSGGWLFFTKGLKMEWWFIRKA